MKTMTFSELPVQIQDKFWEEAHAKHQDCLDTYDEYVLRVEFYPEDVYVIHCDSTTPEGLGFKVVI